MAGDRHSRPAGPPPKVVDEGQRARREVENGFRQHDRLVQVIDENLTAKTFRLRRSAIEELNRLAVDGLVDHPGGLRSTEMEITKSAHKPPSPDKVSVLLDELCDYVNDNWSTRSAQHLAAYVMWRLNWIHPFEDGNGRTTRAVSYLILCMHLGRHLPGQKALPERIVEQKERYYRALEDADRADQKGSTDLSSMETLLGELVTAQVRAALEAEQPAKAPRSVQHPTQDVPQAAVGIAGENIRELKKAPSQILIKVIAALIVMGVVGLFARYGCSTSKAVGSSSSAGDAPSHNQIVDLTDGN